MLMQTHEARLDALRKELGRRGLDGFVIPISDEHMSEYVGAYAQRLAWLTGFGGSAGTAVVLQGQGGDLRRRALHAAGARPGRRRSCGNIDRVPETSPAKWLGENAPEGATIGYDAWLHAKSWAKAAAEALAARRAPAWSRSRAIRSMRYGTTGPSLRMAPALVHEEKYAGRSSAEKRADVAEWLKQKKLDAAVIAALDSIAWLLNIRGIGCRAHAGRAVLRPRPCGRHGRSVHRAGEGHAGACRASRQCRAAAPPRGIRPAPCRRWRASASLPIRPIASPVSFPPSKPAAPRSSKRKTHACCPRRSRTQSRSTATAPRRRATERR